MKIFQVPRRIYSETIDWHAIFQSQLPVVIEGLASKWPSVANDSSKKWADLESLSKRVDPKCLVRIEIGKNYMDPNVIVETMPIKKFFKLLSRSPSAKSNTPFYLAQYELGNIPPLKEEIYVPDICQTGKGHLYNVNMWFGCPTGNSSPCHYDPFNNVLVQIFGSKTVDLVHPSFSENLYPYYGTIQRNTSQVDFDKPDFSKFPLYTHIERHSAVLNSGDGLFIPFKWWHYCRSSSLNCSVNFWWI